MIVVCQHTSTDTFWATARDGSCPALIIPDTRTTLHSDQQLAIVGGFADGFGGGFALVFSLEVMSLVLVVLACKAVLRMVR